MLPPCLDKNDLRIIVIIALRSIWLTINRMTELFGIDKSGISRHLKSIYESGELKRGTTVAKFATVQTTDFAMIA